jgi:DNA sulfur modification protein DndB
LLGKREKEQFAASEEDEQLAVRFWTNLGRQFPEWQSAVTHKISSCELRKEYVHVHSVTLHALGIAGCGLLNQFPKDWQKRLSRLRQIDWSRSNSQMWEGRAMTGGHMSKARQNVQLTASLLKTLLGVALTPDEARLETRYQDATSNIRRFNGKVSQKANVRGQQSFANK